MGGKEIEKREISSEPAPESLSEKIRSFFSRLRRPKVKKIGLSAEAAKKLEPWEQEVIMRAFMENKPVMGMKDGQGNIVIFESKGRTEVIKADFVEKPVDED